MRRRIEVGIEFDAAKVLWRHVAEGKEGSFVVFHCAVRKEREWVEEGKQKAAFSGL